MAALAGPNILLDQSAYNEWKRNKGSYKNRREAKEYNQAYKDWNKLPREVLKRYLTESLNGNRYWMPEHDANELDQYILEHQSVLSDVYKSKQLLRNVSTPADFIDYAFSDKRLSNVESAVAKGGHIAEVSYNSFYKILLVKFAKTASMGDTCAFFNIPANVAALFLHLARTGQMGINGRHQLGIEFWNLVRVRGTVHNTRYAFEYVPSDVIDSAVANGEGSIQQSAGGRREGSKGADNKYFYDDSGRRYEKDENGNPIIKQRGRPKKEGSETESKTTARGEAANEAHKTYVKKLASGGFNKTDKYMQTSTSNINKYNADDLFAYLNDDYGMYHEDVKHTRGSVRSHMQAAYTLFNDSGKKVTNENIEAIKSELRQSGFEFESPEDL